MREKQSGITLIALVVTIIVLLILAGVAISLILGQNGIIARAKTSEEKYEESGAREKLETELATLRIDKQTKESYNKDEYVTEKLEEKECIVNENIIIIDGYQYEIDREELKIVSSLGKGKANEEIKITANQEVSSDYGISKIKVEIEYTGELSSIKIGSEEVTLPEKTENKYIIEKEVTQNGKYSILVKDQEEGYAISSIKVSELTEDMIIRTAEELCAFRDKVNSGGTYEGKTVLLGRNIDLGKVCYKVDGTVANDKSWQAIGTETNSFLGIFDGKGYTINNLYINKTESNQGLFGHLKGNIKNVEVEGTVNGEDNNGIICGKIVANAKITNCIVKGKGTGKQWSGGIAGYNNGGVVEYCINYAEISGTTCTGGICGIETSETALIQYCANYGKIIGSYSNCRRNSRLCKFE